MQSSDVYLRMLRWLDWADLAALACASPEHYGWPSAPAAWPAAESRELDLARPEHGRLVQLWGHAWHRAGARPRVPRLEVSIHEQLLAQLSWLGSPVSIEGLVLRMGWRVTAAAALQCLQGLPRCLPRLSHLDVASCPRLGSEYLPCLEGWHESLRSLRLGAWPGELGASELAPLASLGQLRHLSLSGCRVLADAGLVRLRGLRLLRHLSLSGCGRLTDAGLEHLAGLQGLRHLDLSSCPVNSSTRRLPERRREFAHDLARVLVVFMRYNYGLDLEQQGGFRLSPAVRGIIASYEVHNRGRVVPVEYVYITIVGWREHFAYKKIGHIKFEQYVLDEDVPRELEAEEVELGTDDESDGEQQQQADAAPVVSTTPTPPSTVLVKLARQGLSSWTLAKILLHRLRKVLGRLWRALCAAPPELTAVPLTALLCLCVWKVLGV
eukprot:g59790.t1